MKRGIVYCCDRRAGELVEDGGEYVFRYAPEYLAQPSWPAISATLPKKEGECRAEHLFPFFHGLLAEGAQKERQCRELRIDEDDAFSRLLATRAYDLLDTSVHIPNEASASALDFFADGHFTPVYETLGFYSSVDFVELGACFGVAETEVFHDIERFTACRGRVERLVAASAFSDQAKKLCLSHFHCRLRAISQ